MIPQNNRHGQKIAAVDPSEVSKPLDLDGEAISRSPEKSFYLTPRRVPVDRVALGFALRKSPRGSAA
jgi:hypothetical protein